VRDQNKIKTLPDARPLAGLLQKAIGLARENRTAGNISIALVWESIYVGLGKILLFQLFVSRLLPSLFFMVFILAGYLGTISDNEGWYQGLPFILVAQISVFGGHLRIASMGRLISRRDRLRAGWLGAGFTLVTSILCSLFLYSLLKILALVLPSFEIRGHLWTIMVPGSHVVWASLFVLPLQYLLFVLWRGPSCPSVLAQSGSIIYLLYHAAFVMVKDGQGLWPVVIISGVAWLLLAWAWHWRVLKCDQI
jgi:hypothetical protein